MKEKKTEQNEREGESVMERKKRKREEEKGNEI